MKRRFESLSKQGNAKKGNNKVSVDAYQTRKTKATQTSYPQGYG